MQGERCRGATLELVCRVRVDLWPTALGIAIICQLAIGAIADFAWTKRDPTLMTEGDLGRLVLL